MQETNFKRSLDIIHNIPVEQLALILAEWQNLPTLAANIYPPSFPFKIEFRYDRSSQLYHLIVVFLDKTAALYGDGLLTNTALYPYEVDINKLSPRPLGFLSSDWDPNTLRITYTAKTLGLIKEAVQEAQRSFAQDIHSFYAAGLAPNTDKSVNAIALHKGQQMYAWRILLQEFLVQIEIEKCKQGVFQASITQALQYFLEERTDIYVYPVGLPETAQQINEDILQEIAKLLQNTYACIVLSWALNDEHQIALVATRNEKDNTLELKFLDSDVPDKADYENLKNLVANIQSNLGKLSPDFPYKIIPSFEQGFHQQNDNWPCGICTLFNIFRECKFDFSFDHRVLKKHELKDWLEIIVRAELIQAQRNIKAQKEAQVQNATEETLRSIASKTLLLSDRQQKNLQLVCQTLFALVPTKSLEKSTQSITKIANEFIEFLEWDTKCEAEHEEAWQKINNDKKPERKSHRFEELRLLFENEIQSHLNDFSSAAQRKCWLESILKEYCTFSEWPKDFLEILTLPVNSAKFHCTSAQKNMLLLKTLVKLLPGQTPESLQAELISRNKKPNKSVQKILRERQKDFESKKRTLETELDPQGKKIWEWLTSLEKFPSIERALRELASEDLLTILEAMAQLSSPKSELPKLESFPSSDLYLLCYVWLISYYFTTNPKILLPLYENSKLLIELTHIFHLSLVECAENNQENKILRYLEIPIFHTFIYFQYVYLPEHASFTLDWLNLYQNAFYQASYRSIYRDIQTLIHRFLRIIAQQSIHFKEIENLQETLKKLNGINTWLAAHEEEEEEEEEDDDDWERNKFGTNRALLFLEGLNSCTAVFQTVCSEKDLTNRDLLSPTIKSLLKFAYLYFARPGFIKVILPLSALVFVEENSYFFLIRNLILHINDLKTQEEYSHFFPEILNKLESAQRLQFLELFSKRMIRISEKLKYEDEFPYNLKKITLLLKSWLQLKPLLEKFPEDFSNIKTKTNGALLEIIEALCHPYECQEGQDFENEIPFHDLLRFPEEYLTKELLVDLLLPELKKVMSKKDFLNTLEKIFRTLASVKSQQNFSCFLYSSSSREIFSSIFYPDFFDGESFQELIQNKNNLAEALMLLPWKSSPDSIFTFAKKFSRFIQSDEDLLSILTIGLQKLVQNERTLFWQVILLPLILTFDHLSTVLNSLKENLMNDDPLRKNIVHHIITLSENNSKNFACFLEKTPKELFTSLFKDYKFEVLPPAEKKDPIALPSSPILSASTSPSFFHQPNSSPASNSTPALKEALAKKPDLSIFDDTIPDYHHPKMQ